MGHEVPVCTTRQAGDRTVAERECHNAASELCIAAELQAAVTTARLHRVLSLRATDLQELRLAPGPS